MIARKRLPLTKANERPVPNVFRESNDSRVRDFLMHPELIALQQLEELKKIRETLERIERLQQKTL